MVVALAFASNAFEQRFPNGERRRKPGNIRKRFMAAPVGLNAATAQRGLPDRGGQRETIAAPKPVYRN